jgi:hypothetical protein
MIAKGLKRGKTLPNRLESTLRLLPSIWPGATGIIIILCLAGCASAPPAAPGTGSSELALCPKGAAPEYVVNAILPAPPIDDTLSLAQITKLSEADKRHVVFGLTQTPLVIRSNMALLVVPGSLGGQCAYPTRISLTFDASARVIYIAHEFHGVEPCLYAQILGHEKRHVALDDKILTDATKSLPLTLPDRLAGMDGVWGSDAAAARTALDHRFRKATDALREEFRAGRLYAHAQEIDTPEEERRMFSVCNGRLGELYPQYR